MTIPVEIGKYHNASRKEEEVNVWRTYVLCIDSGEFVG